MALSYGIPDYQKPLLNMGLYALSGAITNWLAIHMLFEKVPGLYGSGIIPNKFQEFKRGIRDLIMGQFFTEVNIRRFFAEQGQSHAIDLEPILDKLDYDRLFEKLKQAVLESPFGAMITMFGGPETLDSLKEPMIEKLKIAIQEITSESAFQDSFTQVLTKGLHLEELITKVDHIVTSRLDELTPKMVKDIIQNMIREHLGWLVVWGGCFGGLIGIAASFMSN